MMGDHDDPLVARLWRGVSGETPGALLDARIMQAARAQQQRRRLLPLAAALAACLVMALYAVQIQSGSPPQQAAMAQPDTTTFGLYEGRVGAQVLDSEAMLKIVGQRFRGSADSGTGHP